MGVIYVDWLSLNMPKNMQSKHKITISFDPITSNFDLNSLQTPVSEIIGVNGDELIRTYLVPTNIIVRSKKAYMTVNLQTNKIYEINARIGRKKYVKVVKRGGLKMISKKAVKSEMEGLRVYRVMELMGNANGIDDH
jgi:hypothetical protein